MKTRRYRAAGGVVIQENEIETLPSDRAYVLLLDRPQRGEVRLPKGHIDPGEDAEETALRETEEESGFGDLTILADLGNRIVEFDYDGERYIRDEHYFLMKLNSDRRTRQPENDAAQFRTVWVELDEAEEELTFAAEQDVVRQAVDCYRTLTATPTSSSPDKD